MQVCTYVLRYLCTSLIKVLKTTGDTYIQTKNVDLTNTVLSRYFTFKLRVRDIYAHFSGYTM